jgi:hypothetical protein
MRGSLRDVGGGVMQQISIEASKWAAGSSSCHAMAYSAS